ncbi:redoxin domain-containing protein [Halostagnicola sp. A-GB9-2]|uniref:redoxin domain-containing protein n=1 Tax=Halostagnicola sp. A-GB9-2 TaxID=3048066 RepID=UPI0024BFA03D|nr:redoxin domain-containing protein [Halostagnicola sp. A-GB9-2]MDJ1432806.1 redoxin domain-containing protein [Halostagnicola sp. A-GB9-2]
MGSRSLALEHSNVGEGPDPVSVAELASDTAFLVLLLMQSHRSGTCRQQVRKIAAEYDEFRRRDATVAAVVPGTHPKVRSWRRLVDPPFPILADDDGVVREEFHQPTQYGTIGRFVASIGRVPVTLVLDCRDGDPSVVYSYEGQTSLDRPLPVDILAAIDEL